MSRKSGTYETVAQRLTDILIWLYEGRKVSAAELAREFNVSTRTMQRDRPHQARRPTAGGRCTHCMSWPLPIGVKCERRRTLLPPMLSSRCGGSGCRTAKAPARRLQSCTGVRWTVSSWMKRKTWPPSGFAPCWRCSNPAAVFTCWATPEPALYPREPLTLADAVHIRSQDNVRSPRQIVQTINLLGLTRQRVVPRCPEPGGPPDIRHYSAQDPHGLQELDRVLRQLMANGVAPQDMTVISFVGREHSRVLACETLADVPLCKFTGSFDPAGNAVWAGGQLLAETLYRFKGQAAPYVVLCKVDFAVLDDKERRKLFVGMTQAQWHLTMVVSASAEVALLDRLTQAQD